MIGFVTPPLPWRCERCSHKTVRQWKYSNSFNLEWHLTTSIIKQTGYSTIACKTGLRYFLWQKVSCDWNWRIWVEEEKKHPGPLFQNSSSGWGMPERRWSQVLDCLFIGTRHHLNSRISFPESIGTVLAKRCYPTAIGKRSSERNRLLNAWWISTHFSHSTNVAQVFGGASKFAVRATCYRARLAWVTQNRSINRTILTIVNALPVLGEVFSEIARKSFRMRINQWMQLRSELFGREKKLHVLPLSR